MFPYIHRLYFRITSDKCDGWEVWPLRHSDTDTTLTCNGITVAGPVPYWNVDVYNNIMTKFSSKSCREGGVWSITVPESHVLKLV